MRLIVVHSFSRIFFGILTVAVTELSSEELTPKSPRNLQAQKLSESPQLDGVVNEPLWYELDVATNFIQQNPDEGEPSTEKTEVRIGFDDRNLYIAIICFDSQPENIVVTQNRRDAYLGDTDSIQVILDTFNDGQNAFIFGTSPAGVEYDVQISKAGQSRGRGGSPARAGVSAQRGGSTFYNRNWDGVWKVRSQITGRGWESEMLIPFRTLRYKPGESTWGLNIMRNLRRRSELSFWSPISRAFRLTQINLAGSLSGLKTKTHRNLKLFPYITGGFSQDYRRDKHPFRLEKNAGLDLKYSLTSSLTLDFTLNTDFSQIEVDSQQVNLTRFDLFFPEKRTFFLENSGFFDFGSPGEVEIFFSRRIGLDENRTPVPIVGGARVTGKVGPYQFGLLNMQTRSVNEAAPSNNYGVARISRELPNRSSIGVIGVTRKATTAFNGEPRFNGTYGADANIGLGKFANWFNYTARTETPGLTDSNHSHSSSFQYDNSRHEFTLSYLEVGHNFNPEVGFVNRVGFRKPTYFYRYTHYLTGSRIRHIQPHFSGKTWHTLGTNAKESGFEHYHVDSLWQNRGRLGLAWNRNFERLGVPFEVYPGVFIPAGKYQFGEIIGNFKTDPSEPIFLSGTFAAGSFYNGGIKASSIRGGYRKGKKLTWIGSWSRNLIDLPVGIFKTDLIGLRFNWSFTPKSYFQTFSQYNNISREIDHNLRLGLLSTSSTGLFVVFNSGTSTEGFLDPHSIRRQTISRALFVKFTHLLDY